MESEPQLKKIELFQNESIKKNFEMKKNSTGGVEYPSMPLLS